MEVEVVMKLAPRFQQPYQRTTAGREERLLRLLVGDDSGARSQLSVPYQKRQARPHDRFLLTEAGSGCVSQSCSGIGSQPTSTFHSLPCKD